VIADADIGIHGNTSGQVPARGLGAPPPHVYAVSYNCRPQHVTGSSSNQQPASSRHVTFADNSLCADLAGDGDDADDEKAGCSGCSAGLQYGSSEWSDVTSITSGSYYIGEDLNYRPPPPPPPVPAPAPFLFV